MSSDLPEILFRVTVRMDRTIEIIGKEGKVGNNEAVVASLRIIADTIERGDQRLTRQPPQPPV